MSSKYRCRVPLRKGLSDLMCAVVTKHVHTCMYVYLYIMQFHVPVVYRV